ncbi:MAG: ABC transporter permease [Clostridiales bacterium]|nr:ABC transporter permease [Clostridiales bacterium]
MTFNMLIAILAAAITSGTPILFAALGEIVTEKSGVQNLGLEGMMLVGAVSGFMMGYLTHNLFLAVLVAALGGGILALIHSFITITLKANQVVSGLALTIFGTGLSGYLGKPYIGMPAPVKFEIVPIPILSKIPVIGTIFFNHNLLVYFSYILIFVLWFYIYRTRQGLNLRATGENPGAADSLGVNVFRLRYLYTVIGGMLAGIGGAYLSLASAPSWVENMSGGRGWLAVALVIFAVWNPARAVFGAYLFGGVEALGYRMQAIGVTVSPFFLNMMPYLLTIIVLIIVTINTQHKHIGEPEALGKSYDREER